MTTYDKHRILHSNPVQTILPLASQNEAVMFHQEKFDMALKDLGGWVAQTVDFFVEESCRGTKRCGSQGFWDRFFWMLVLCDLDLF